MVRGSESRPAFAARFGVHKNTLVRYENGQSQPAAAFLQQICEAFRINPSWLLLGVGQMKVGGEAPDEAAAAGADRPEMRGPVLEYGQRESDLAFAKGFELLAKIYGSCNQVLISAIIANLLAFSDAIDNKQRAIEAEAKIAKLEERLEKLEKRLGNISESGEERAEGGDGQ